jgi:hypothetical protein
MTFRFMTFKLGPTDLRSARPRISNLVPDEIIISAEFKSPREGKLFVASIKFYAVHGVVRDIGHYRRVLI